MKSEKLLARFAFHSFARRVISFMFFEALPAKTNSCLSETQRGPRNHHDRNIYLMQLPSVGWPVQPNKRMKVTVILLNRTFYSKDIVSLAVNSDQPQAQHTSIIAAATRPPPNLQEQRRRHNSNHRSFDWNGVPRSKIHLYTTNSSSSLQTPVQDQYGHFDLAGPRELRSFLLLTPPPMRHRSRRSPSKMVRAPAQQS
jgi:hypothetical protein